ncbi:Core-2/I-branching beta-1,6-N-acetylglucosaminyltransferase family protein [Striga asiatica]|uniref:Core-2/I-branching beta-1,6-N-acetylglucosaminyltransferase family protein n=1 Tax=Striga asiatica TaxID=4170 RepID=A0A5A7QWK3_STRAF|nr:Core-2/I-branching beta-1,6-N-acetylglucosaminyltransferase family protein [Striga asiatica]
MRGIITSYCHGKQEGGVRDYAVFGIQERGCLQGELRRDSDRGVVAGCGATLHATSLLLRIDNGDWDWFVPLSMSDYPLLAQDATVGLRVKVDGGSRSDVRMVMLGSQREEATRFLLLCVRRKKDDGEG